MVIMMMINSSSCNTAKGAVLNQRERGGGTNVVGREEIVESQRKRKEELRSENRK